MTEFLEFFDEISQRFSMHLEISYSRICTWSIYIYKKGCAKDGTNLIIVNVSDCDMKLCFAKAHVELKKWLIENAGGY